MGPIENLGAFALFAIIAAFTPGPNNIMLAASGANFGLRRTLPHLCGVTAGFMCVVASGGLGLGGLFAIAPYLYDIMRLCAFGFLAYLAYRIASATPNADKTLHNQIEGNKTASQPLGFWPAFAFQWMNPKAFIVVFSAITAYINEGVLFFPSLLAIIFVFFIVTVLSTCLWCWLGSLIARFLSTPTAFRMFNISMAILLVGSLLPVLISM